MNTLATLAKKWNVQQNNHYFQQQNNQNATHRQNNSFHLHSGYDERSRSSSGTRSKTPNIKRSASSVNVVTRKSGHGTVFALTTSSAKISVSKKVWKI